MNTPEKGNLITSDGSSWSTLGVAWTSRSRRGKHLTAALFVLCLVAGVGVAKAVDLLRENPMSAAITLSSSTTGSVSSDWTTPLDPLPVDGDPTVNVTSLFSATGANAANVHIGFYTRTGASGSYTYHFDGQRNLGTITHNASSGDGFVTISGTTYYSAEITATAPRSSTHYDVRVMGAVSSGTVKFRRWTHGASGAAH